MKKIMVSLILFFILFVYGCTTQQDTKSTVMDGAVVNTTVERNTTQLHWKLVPLIDVLSGEKFTIADFAGKPFLIESFAVWCPVCLKQQQEIKKLHEKLGEAVVSVSLDTDPNEDMQKVLEAVQERGFTWRFAISPIEVTKALIEEFGPAVVNAPIAPIILVCEDGSTRLLGKGVKDVEELEAELERGC